MIERSRYIGYLWYSDEDMPKVLKGDEELELALDPNVNPFIVEGQLYSPVLAKSVSIKYVDGAYLVNEFQVSEEDIRRADAFESNRIEGVTLLFVQRWAEKPDGSCLGMPVSVPAGLVFVGFEKAK